MRRSQSFFFVCIAFCFGLTVRETWAGTHASPVPESTPSIVPLDASRLRKEFIRALENEVKAARQRRKAELEDLKASQKARTREFSQRERDERRKFFESNTQPAKRREYVQDFVKRRAALKTLFAEELKSRKAERRAAEHSLQESQKKRLQEFDAAIASGKRPSDELWPQPGN